MRTNHEIDYRIYGEELKFVEIELDPNENGRGRKRHNYDDGWRDNHANHFGDGSTEQQRRVTGKLFQPAQRLLVGESLFMSAFTNVGQGKWRKCFAAPHTGKIVTFDLQQLGGKIIAQKDAFSVPPRREHRHWIPETARYNFGGEGFHHGKTRRRRARFAHAGVILSKGNWNPGNFAGGYRMCGGLHTPTVDFAYWHRVHPRH